MRAGCRFLGILTIAAVLLVACASAPSTPTVPAMTMDVTQEAAPVDATTMAQPPFIATEELKKKTFDEVQAVIDELDRIIGAGDYDQWLTYLTADFTRSRSSEQFLAEASSAQVLRENNIVLHSLKDYFENVVVRSHMQAELDDITFVDETHVKAYTRVQGVSYILYYLVREDGRWKIGILPSADNGAGRTGEVK